MGSTGVKFVTHKQGGGIRMAYTGRVFMPGPSFAHEETYDKK